MHEEQFRAIEAGATVVTASRRLARVLRRQFDLRQRAQGRAVWRTSDILPLDAFLSRAWRDWILSGAQADVPALLDSLQEQYLWEQVIRDSPHGDTLLRIPETALQAMDAWKLVWAYRLLVDGRFEASEDWSAFAAWSRTFEKRCRSNNWIEQARLGDFVAEKIQSGEIPRKPLLYRAGFDDLTPQQSDFFDATGEWLELPAAACVSHQERWKFQDNTAELRAAAIWARSRLEENPHARIGIIVPNLTGLRRKVERIFQETLHPGDQNGRTRSFHLSLGPALAEYPLLNAALLMLEFALGPLPLPRAGMLLRSAFLGAAETECAGRALLDAQLRRKGLWDVTTAHLAGYCAACPLLERALRRIGKLRRNLPEKQLPSAWSRDFSELLEAFGWPGDRTLNSREHQIVEAWLGLLSGLAALDLAAPAITFSEALSRLQDLAAVTPFQVENEDAPVEIMGVLEASGLRFDHLWMTGLHDQALPAAASPNPFIPISMQRERGLPHASAEQQLTFASLLIDRLLSSAPDVLLSYPETEGDQVFLPSPLVPGLAWQAHPSPAGASDWIVRIRANVPIEELGDEIAPPLAPDSMQPGGASLFKDVAACQFRAFGKHRLGARELDDTSLGLSYKDRGGTVHKALELILAELGSHERLMGLAPAEVQDLISRSVASAVDRLSQGIGRKLEKSRLQALLTEWLEIEKSRAPFTVLKPEEERFVTIGGVQVRTRVDRIDELTGGGEIILDYKTGQIKSTAWDTGRPDEPQLPLYCATSPRPISGAAFAVIRTGELAFRGITENHATLPGMKKMQIEQPASFAEQVNEWRRVLERLAAEYCEGHAAVDPKPGACEYCGLTALCRIRELEYGLR